MRAVLDLNVVVSALLTPGGPAGVILACWFAGELEVAVCPKWRQELREVLSRDRFASVMGEGRLDEFLELVDRFAWPAADPAIVPAVTRDPDDDYLLALAHDADGVIVTGDRHLLDLAPSRGVVTIRQLLDRLTLEAET